MYIDMSQRITLEIRQKIVWAIFYLNMISSMITL